MLQMSLLPPSTSAIAHDHSGRCQRRRNGWVSFIAQLGPDLSESLSCRSKFSWRFCYQCFIRKQYCRRECKWAEPKPNHQYYIQSGFKHTPHKRSAMTTVWFPLNDVMSNNQIVIKSIYFWARHLRFIFVHIRSYRLSFHFPAYCGVVGRIVGRVVHEINKLEESFYITLHT